MDDIVDQSVSYSDMDYDDPKNTKKVDQAYAMASQQVFLESQQIFAKVMPLIAQMQQQLDQLKQQAQPQDPDAQILLQTSMAETQRRAARDKADTAIAQQRLQMDQQLESAKLAQKQQEDQSKNQMDILLNRTDNQTKQTIESAKIAHDKAVLQHEQAKTALDLAFKPQTY